MRIPLLLFATFLALGVNAQETEAPVVPRLTVEIGPPFALATNGYIGGQIVIKARLLSRHPFEALQLKLPRLSGAEIIEVQRPRTRKVNGYGGRGHVFETAVAIIPQTAGTLKIPPVTAVGMVEPEPGRELDFDLASDPVDIKIAGVSPRFDNPWWLVSERVEMEETWSTPPQDIRVGDVVQRTVHIHVWGVPAEHLPTIEHGRTRDMKVSLAGHTSKTEKSPDGLIGHATYTWDLEAEPRQVAFIAPIGLDYWHPGEHRARRLAVPGLRLEPLPADSAEIAALLMREAAGRRNQVKIYAAAALGVLGLPVAILFGAFLVTRLPTRADRRLKTRTAIDPDPSNLYREFDTWLSVSGWLAGQFDSRHASRRGLSDQLFGPSASVVVRNQLISDAFRFSRWIRTRKLLDRLRHILNH